MSNPLSAADSSLPLLSNLDAPTPLPTDSSETPVPAGPSLLQSNSARAALAGPFDNNEANELYWACLKSGDSPRDAKVAVRRAGY